MTSLMTKLAGLKLRLKLAGTHEVAGWEFEEFAASNPTDEELELASIHHDWTLFELEQRQ